jgi:hypothetical protein
LWATPEEVATFLTEADGSFLIPRVPDGRYRLRVLRHDWHLNVRDEAEVEITVKGQPVRGVKLRFRGEEPEATLSGHIRGVAPADLSRVWIVAADSRNHLGGIIDSRGTYRISGLYPGEWKLEAGAPNGKAEARLHISPGQTEATLDLEIQHLKGKP